MENEQSSLSLWEDREPEMSKSVDQGKSNKADFSSSSYGSTQFIHISNLKRPILSANLESTLHSFGDFGAHDFWFDDYHLDCGVKYGTVEQAEKARNALDGVKWSNTPESPTIKVDFITEAKMERLKNSILAEKSKNKDNASKIQAFPRMHELPIRFDREFDNKELGYYSKKQMRPNFGQESEKPNWKRENERYREEPRRRENDSYRETRRSFHDVSIFGFGHYHDNHNRNFVDKRESSFKRRNEGYDFGNQKRSYEYSGRERELTSRNESWPPRMENQMFGRKERRYY